MQAKESGAVTIATRDILQDLFRIRTASGSKAISQGLILAMNRREKDVVAEENKDTCELAKSMHS